MPEITYFPHDARNRPLREGDEVLLGTQLPVQWRVAQITPVLDPQARPGTAIVHLIAVANFPVQGGQKHSNIIRIQTAEEAGPMPFQVMDVSPAPPPGN